MSESKSSDGLLVVIFSYNRALQLDYTLKCLFARLKTPRLEVAVIYHTYREHVRAYEILREEHEQNGVKFF